ncbi:MAG TPA: fatty acyl-AMP ligase, partial [Thermoanaerobaculia bacterium]|nr:fatty acyl-AMP ligase [Thermoanaerobaculia bacterium]
MTVHLGATTGSGSLAELLRTRAEQRPDPTVYTFLADGEVEASRLSNAELDARARQVAVRLASAGAARGDRALLLFTPGLDFIVAFFGCLYAGVVAVPAYPPRPGRGERVARRNARLTAIARDAAPRVVLTEPAIAERAEELSAAIPELAAAVWIEAVGDPGAEEAWEPPSVAGDDVAFLQYTSGSTAAPRGVEVSHANLLHNEEMIRRAFAQDEDSVVVSWLPLYHDMGLIGGVLQPLFTGGRCVLMSPQSFLQQPLRWVRAISRYRATTSGGPNFGYELAASRATPESCAELDLSCWQVAFNGAEPVRAATLERFAAAFAPAGFDRRAFFPCYGLAEATLFVTGGAPGRGARTRQFDTRALEHEGRAETAAGGEGAPRELVACGAPWMGQRVEVVAPESRRPLPPGVVGEVWVAGPSVARGYRGRPAETAETFGARLAGEPEAGPFLRTGDLGFLDGGELFVTGRLKDLIILRGRNLYPQDVEESAERAHAALRLGAGAAFPVEVDGEERLVVAWEVEPRSAAARSGEAVEEVAAAVREAVAESHEVRPYEVVLLRPGALPRTSSGKVRRGACRQAWLAGALAAVGRSAEAPVAGAAA